MRAAVATLAVTLSLTAAARQIYDVNDQGIMRPELVKDVPVPARYTPDAMRRKIEGSVLLRGVILESGRVADVKVVESLDPELDQEAVAAFSKWAFKPGTKERAPVAVRVTCKMAFAFKD